MTTTATTGEYRERLGPYADMVLRGGEVPFGAEEHISYVINCIEAEGFHVTRIDGGFQAEPGTEQMERYREVKEACDESAVESGLVATPEPADEEMQVLQYRAKVHTYECMVEHGYPTSPPPSEDAYLSGEAGWHLYDLIDPRDFAEVDAVCPQDLVAYLERLVADGEAP